MPIELNNCQICHQSEFEPIEPFDDPAIQTQYVACQNCGLVFMNPRPSDEEVAAFYASNYWSERRPLEQSIAKQRGFGEHIAAFVAKNIEQAGGKQFSELGSILEVGASFGATLDVVRTAVLDAGGSPSLFAIEPSPEAPKAGEKNYENITVIGSRLEELKDQTEKSFDLIILSHVLEHLSDPVEALSILGSRLSEQGVLFVEVPNYYGHPSLEYVHNYCFTESSFRNCFAAAGMQNAVVDINGHHEDFPFYLATLAVNQKSESTELAIELFEEIKSKRTAAKEAFKKFRENNPRKV